MQVIDESMAKGIWNAGLMSTQAGTIGRLCGNLMLTLVSTFTGAATSKEISKFAAFLFGTNAAWMVFSVGYVLLVYGRLVG